MATYSTGTIQHVCRCCPRMWGDAYPPYFGILHPIAHPNHSMPDASAHLSGTGTPTGPPGPPSTVNRQPHIPLHCENLFYKPRQKRILCPLTFDLPAAWPHPKARQPTKPKRPSTLEFDLHIAPHPSQCHNVTMENALLLENFLQNLSKREPPFSSIRTQVRAPLHVLLLSRDGAALH
jgi:hypothetical protein